MDIFDKLIFGLLIVANIIQRPMSISCHLFIPINADVANFWKKYDVGNIYIAGCVKAFVLSYYSIPLWAFIMSYIVTLSIAYYGLTLVSNFKPGKPLDAKFQAFIVGSFFLCMYFSPACYFVTDMFGESWTLSFICAVLLWFSFFVCGAAYAFGVPEKLAPGHFDIIGSSHNIMHIGMILSDICECLFLFDQFQRHRHLLQ